MQPTMPPAQNPYGPGQAPAMPPKKHANGLLIPLVIVVLLFIATLVFALWAYASQQDYKANSDKKAAAAALIAKQETATAKDKEFTEKEKNPLKTYTGPSTYGSVVVQYPKTYSAYVSETGSSTPVDGYFHPNIVPGLDSKQPYALRVQVVNQSYDQVLKSFESNVKAGKSKVSVFKAVKVPSVTGSRVDGVIIDQTTGSMVLVPLRDKTLKVWTEANQYVNDFNTIVLPNLQFSP